MAYLCFDIGGTAIKYRILLEDGNPVTSLLETPTEVTKTDNNIVWQIVDIAKRIVQTSGVVINGICIATAGVVDPRKGEIISAGYTIPNYTGAKIRSTIEREMKLPCSVENDVNCTLLGERWKNRYQYKNIFCMTIGTGVGGALYLDNRLYRGTQFNAGEIGYIPWKDKKDFQQVCSTQSLVDLVNLRTKQDFKNGREIMAVLRAGSSHFVFSAFEEWFAEIMNMLSIIECIINPEVFIIGGGVFAPFPGFQDRLNTLIQTKTRVTTPVLLANQGNSAGLYGALYHFQHGGSSR
ncbi:ROK family protein [Lapidilactobacillus achengensis]|uniref:ROK family protein n=1 Tax=Lapidilactobacillus achengensis TaxID=2486000 RepID=A0ABW1URF6_9LACO|nr:ROK family protein [Lapidilactobacillus achengensis]